VCDFALARLAEFAGAGRVAGCRNLGAASGSGGIGGVGDGTEERPERFVLFSFDLGLFADALGAAKLPIKTKFITRVGEG